MGLSEDPRKNHEPKQRPIEISHTENERKRGLKKDKAYNNCGRVSKDTTSNLNDSGTKRL